MKHEPTTEQAAAATPSAPTLLERYIAYSRDFFVLRFVIHDWLDPEAAAILRTIRTSAKSSSRLMLIERVIPETSAFDCGKMTDLWMLTYMGSQERTAAAYRRLLENAGFELEQIVPTPEGPSLIVSRPRV